MVLWNFKPPPSTPVKEPQAYTLSLSTGPRCSVYSSGFVSNKHSPFPATTKIAWLLLQIASCNHKNHRALSSYNTGIETQTGTKDFNFSLILFTSYSIRKNFPSHWVKSITTVTFCYMWSNSFWICKCRPVNLNIPSNIVNGILNLIWCESFSPCYLMSASGWNPIISTADIGRGVSSHSPSN